MSMLTLCEDCSGGAERCLKEGHIRGVEVTIFDDVGKRVFRCQRCKEDFAIQLCERCGRELPQVTQE